MNKYPSYKDSGVEWIGDIPGHWIKKKLGYSIDTIVPMRDKPTSLKGEIPWIRIEDYDGKYIYGSKSNQGVTQGLIDEMNLKVYPINTVLTTCSCSFGTSMIVKEPMTSNQTFIGLFPNKKDLNEEYLYYQLHIWEVELDKMSSGSIQKYLSRDNFKSLRFLFPPINEQQQIVSFLDVKTAQIDALIEKTRRKIELLKEKRTALINEVVTKGLNPNVEMKDSGIYWLGEIPDGWEASYLKRFCEKITDGSHHSPQTEFEGKNYISVRDIGKKGEIDLLNCKKITEEDFNDLVRNGCQPKHGDVLLTKDGTIGRASVVSDENDFVCLSSLGIISPFSNKFDSEYLRYFLISSVNVTQMFSLIAGSALTRLTIEKIKHLVVTKPPLSEQNEIVTYLDKQTELIDKTISIEEKKIELLKEYRRSLISEAVTGKIDVRNWQAPKS